MTYALPEVLEFYRTLPFNYYDTIESQAKSVQTDRGSLEAHGPLVELLQKPIRVLDVGCGAGWLSNLISFRFGCETVGIDFNAVAVERAAAVSAHLRLNSRFIVHDLFTYFPDPKFDLVVSMGVLHHTGSCVQAIRHLLRNTVLPGGHLYLGLYHLYGRRPFLEYFDSLKRSGATEDELFAKYKQLHSYLKDETHLRSWFRDQVLHPHETQHSLAELIPLIDEENATLISTSINRFQPIQSTAELLELERTYSQRGRDALKEKRYFPGFFTVLIRTNR